MVHVQETSYRYELDVEAAIEVRFVTRRDDVVDYAVVLLVEERNAWRAVRVYDNVHQMHDMHRYNRAGEKQTAETFHRGSADEALQSAIEAVRDGYSEMIESWRR